MYSDRNRNWRRPRIYHAVERPLRLEFTPLLGSSPGAGGATPPRPGNEVYNVNTPPRSSSRSGNEVYFQNTPPGSGSVAGFGATPLRSGSEFVVDNQASARLTTSINERSRLLAPAPEKPSLEDLYSKINWDPDLEEGEIAPNSEPWDVEAMMELFRMQKPALASSSHSHDQPMFQEESDPNCDAAAADAGDDYLSAPPPTPSPMEGVYSKFDWRVGHVPESPRAWDGDDLMDTYEVQRSAPPLGVLLPQPLPASPGTWIEQPQHGYVNSINAPYLDIQQFNTQPPQNLVTLSPWAPTLQPMPEPEPCTPQSFNPSVLSTYEPPNLATYTCSPPNIVRPFTPSSMDQPVPPQTLHIASGHSHYPQHLVNPVPASRSVYRPPTMHHPNAPTSVVWSPTPNRRADQTVYFTSGGSPSPNRGVDQPVYFASGQEGERGASERGPIRTYSHHRWHHPYQ